METLLARAPDVEILAFGEPTHAEPAFPRLRNRILSELAGRGFRSIAVETDRIAGLAVDDHVRGGGPPADGCAASAADQELIAWLREYNAARPPAERIAFHGFDTPLEMTGAPRPGPLRYHADCADGEPGAARTSRLLGLRDAWMARRLLDIRDLEQRRGPTLVFAGNRHLQRHPSRWTLAGMELRWWSAGAILSEVLGDRYAVVIGSLGASAALGLQPPAADTYEGALRGGPFFPAADLPAAAAVRDAVDGYFPLDADTVAGCDAVWHVDRYPAAAAEMAARIRRLPDVHETHAGPDTGAPELAWDEHFFFAGDDRKRPFATIVGHDIPGFDATSRLDRAGVYRLNIELGRDRFRDTFGYGPEQFPAHRDTLDFAALDEILPHPVYAAQGWACVLNPGVRCGARVTQLISYGRDRAARRRRS